jgi:hypothetical protein
MEIRITKRPPAPKMDGFETSGFEVGRVYVVGDRLGQYLLANGYAATVPPRERSEEHLPSRPRPDQR